jgi:hypothetical protein
VEPFRFYFGIAPALFTADARANKVAQARRAVSRARKYPLNKRSTVSIGAVTVMKRMPIVTRGVHVGFVTRTHEKTITANSN